MTTEHNPGDTALLLEKCWAGDRAALHSLVLRDLEWVRGYIHRNLDGVVRQHADTDDVVQEVMVRVLESGPSFVVDSREVCRRLLGRIVLNTLTSMARRYTARKRRPGANLRERQVSSDSVLYLEGDQPRKSVTRPELRVARAEETEWVHLAMELLAARDHEALRLRDWDGLSFREIGGRLGLEEDAARMCYRRALVKMSSCLVQLRQGRVERVLEELEQS